MFESSFRMQQSMAFQLALFLLLSSLLVVGWSVGWLVVFVLSLKIRQIKAGAS